MNMLTKMVRTEKWKLPKSVDEVKAEIQEMIDIGEGEIKQLETNREYGL